MIRLHWLHDNCVACWRLRQGKGPATSSLGLFLLRIPSYFARSLSSLAAYCGAVLSDAKTLTE